MDLEGIFERIPSTEKILGVGWILCWILAIWIHHLQFFLTGLFFLFLAFILIGVHDKKQERKHPKQPTVFTMDKSTKTLTVQKIYEDNLKWNDHEICSGNATLPSGLIKEGDEIKDCEGNIAIRHKPSNTLFGGYDFEE
jgi:hypothetical protein